MHHCLCRPPSGCVSSFITDRASISVLQLTSSPSPSSLPVYKETEILGRVVPSGTRLVLLIGKAGYAVDSSAEKGHLETGWRTDDVYAFNPERWLHTDGRFNMKVRLCLRPDHLPRRRPDYDLIFRRAPRSPGAGEFAVASARLLRYIEKFIILHFARSLTPASPTYAFIDPRAQNLPRSIFPRLLS